MYQDMSSAHVTVRLRVADPTNILFLAGLLFATTPSGSVHLPPRQPGWSFSRRRATHHHAVSTDDGARWENRPAIRS